MGITVHGILPHMCKCLSLAYSEGNFRTLKCGWLLVA